jgi:hypothetical protein
MAERRKSRAENELDFSTQRHEEHKGKLKQDGQNRQDKKESSTSLVLNYSVNQAAKPTPSSREAYF